MSKNFDSLETDSPFTVCSACSCDLTDAPAYIINKAYSNNECVFEMALCLACREELNNQLSEKSKKAIQNFIDSNSNIDAKLEELGDDYSVDEALAHCLTCNKETTEERNFSIGCMFTQGIVVPGTFPMLICGGCEERMNEYVSPETRGSWNRFIGEHFPGPPSEVTLPTNKPVLI